MSAGGGSGSDASWRTPGTSLVESPFYRNYNLLTNDIVLRAPQLQLPDTVAMLVLRISGARDSPEPEVEELRANTDLQKLEDGAAESSVEQYFTGTVFSLRDGSDGLQRTTRLPMARFWVPQTADAQYKVSPPVPDLLYGYDFASGFPRHTKHIMALGPRMTATTAIPLYFPFLVVEFKGEGGSLWVATNQCLGGSASSVNLMERLNKLLPLAREFRAVFGIAMNGTEARIYVSWFDDGTTTYYSQKIRSFCLQDAEHYVLFRHYARNILDWGKTTRLQALRDALDCVTVAELQTRVGQPPASPVSQPSRPRGRSLSVDSDVQSAGSAGKKQKGRPDASSPGASRGSLA